MDKFYIVSDEPEWTDTTLKYGDEYGSEGAAVEAASENNPYIFVVQVEMLTVKFSKEVIRGSS